MLALYFGWDATDLERMTIADVQHYLSAARQLWQRDNRFAEGGSVG